MTAMQRMRPAPYVPPWNAMYQPTVGQSMQDAAESRAVAGGTQANLVGGGWLGRLREDFRNFFGIPAGGLFASGDRRTPEQVRREAEAARAAETLTNVPNYNAQGGQTAPAAPIAYRDTIIANQQTNPNQTPANPGFSPRGVGKELAVMGLPQVSPAPILSRANPGFSPRGVSNKRIVRQVGKAKIGGPQMGIENFLAPLGWGG